MIWRRPIFGDGACPVANSELFARNQLPRNVIRADTGCDAVTIAELRGAPVQFGQMSRKRDHVHSRANYQRDYGWCARCRAMNTEYGRKHRAARLTGKRPNNVTPITSAKGVQVSQKTQPPPVVGPNLAAVRAQCANNELAAARPATVSQAEAMAMIMDDPDCRQMHVQASRQLDRLLASLTPKQAVRRKGRLGVVSAMVSGAVAQ